jgi:iron only hydrogenase large subunit-like protein
MIVTGTRIRAADPEALVVFVGPCLAKKREAATSGVIDYCISFEELGAMFVAAGIDVQECVPIHADETGSVVGRAFPVTGGVSGAIDGALAARGRKDGDAAITTTRIDGIDRETMKVLTRLGRNPEKGGPDGARFVEVMACPGGCVGGPLAYGNLRTATKAVQKVVAGA